ncbi:MAG: peptidylprolyl isomerase [Candidatus Omnitrophica bacterium]|nr:peptidylprolyl isomerase [Candidatus Omnitrophota bacterium]
MIENGKRVKIHYTLTVEGFVVDSSEGQEPLQYTQGNGEIIVGLERQLLELNVGDRREITVSPEDGYGLEDPAAFVEVAKDRLPEGDLLPGMQFLVTRQDGSKMPVTITEVKEDSVILNLNHPLAGKELIFTIEIIAID